MKIPYVGYTNDTLEQLPIVKEGDEVACRTCEGLHKLECGTTNGQKSSLLMFYVCNGNGNSYLAAINGRLIMFKKADVSGSI